MSDGGGLAPAGGNEYTVVLRARSSAHFLPEEGWEHHFSLPALTLGTVRTRAFTRWVKEGAHSIPRELVVEVKGRAGSLDEAVAKFSMIARPIANMIGFVANVRVGSIEAHLAFDSDPGRAERQFLEVFLPGNWIGLPEFVIPDVHSVAAGGQGFLCQAGSGIQGSAWAARVRASRAPMPWRAAVAT